LKKTIQDSQENITNVVSNISIAMNSLHTKLDSLKESITSLITESTEKINAFIEKYAKHIDSSLNEIDASLNQIIIGEIAENDGFIHNLLISDVVGEILSYYTNYISGKITDVASVLTIEKFNELSISLHKLKSSLTNKSDYEMIRKIILTSFEALMQMINQNAQYIALQNSYNTVSEKAKVLDDLQKLETYIVNLTNSSEVIFIPEVKVNAPLFSIKPEIQAYIDKYGSDKVDPTK
jgi:hypothetical protein